DAQHVVEVVRDAAGEAADRLEALGAVELELELPAIGHVEPGAVNLAAAAAPLAGDDGMIDEAALAAVGAEPAIGAADGAALAERGELRLGARAVLGMDPLAPEIRIADEPGG